MIETNAQLGAIKVKIKGAVPMRDMPLREIYSKSKPTNFD